MTEFGKLIIGSYIGIIVAVLFAIMWWESGRVGGVGSEVNRSKGER